MISKKRMVFIIVMILLIALTGLYVTYSLNIYLEEGTPTEYDTALNFSLSETLNAQMTIPAGKTKIFDQILQ